MSTNNYTISYYKKTGETPLQCIERFRKEFSQYADEKISYAGRLDPMAEGQMLLVLGEGNKNREAYLSLDKVYTFQILFGVSTDTGDVLGIVEDSKDGQPIDEESLRGVTTSLVGKHTQKYPWFSSKTVLGKPLFEWFREGRQNEIKRPKHDIDIYDMRLLRLGGMAGQHVENYILDKISLVYGDFRQGAIAESWRNYFAERGERSFQIAEIEMSCSSGTYVREVVQEIGARFDMPALALHIVRKHINTLFDN